jgi:hypothetical protein
MGLRSRNKGKRGEREAAAEIRRIFRTDASRGRQFAGSDDSPDIRTAIPKVHFEVNREAWERSPERARLALSSVPDRGNS